nr:MAG TPA: hypothetical protein [Caudoviricetes sp.]
MMEREWQGILSQYGQNVVLSQGGEQLSIKALIQPVLEESRVQEIPSPLGVTTQERYLYLGPADHPLDMDTGVQWHGRDYQVQRAHRAGEGVCPYQWAVLCPKDEEKVWGQE